MGENFNNYTENDPSSQITRDSATQISLSAFDRNSEGYVYDDKGSAHFDGDFEHQVDFNITSAASGGWVSNWALTNSVDDIRGILDASGSCLYTRLFYNGANYNVALAEIDSGAIYQGVVYNFSTSTDYYTIIDRDESIGSYGQLRLRVYSDADRTTLLNTQTISLHTSKKDYQYVSPVQSSNDGQPTWTITGTISNFSLYPIYVVNVWTNTGTSTSPNVSVGAITEGNSLLAVIAKDDDVTVDTHADWTEKVSLESNNAIWQYVAVREATASEPGSWTWTCDNETWVAAVIEIEGGDFSTIAVGTTGVGTDSTPDAPSVTPSADGAMVFSGFSVDRGRAPRTLDAAILETDADLTTGTGAGDIAQIIGHFNQNTAGVTGAFVHDCTNSDEWAAWTLYIEPDVGLGPVPVGLVSETDTAFPIGALKTASIAQASETDSAFTVTAPTVVSIGSSLEADSAFTVTTSKNLAIGLTIETDSAFIITVPQIISIGLSTETDSAFGISVLKQYPVGLASEANTAFTLGTTIKTVQTGLASEADTAFAINIAKALDIGLSTEVDSAFAATYSFGWVVGLSSESDSGFAVGSAKNLAISLVIETSGVFPIDVVKNFAIGLAVETDTAEGQALLISESFEGVGYEEIWSEAIEGANTLDPDAAIPGTPPPGSGSQCLKAIVADATDNDAFCYKTLGAQEKTYQRGYLYVDTSGLGNGESLVCFGGINSGNLVTIIYIINDAGTLKVGFIYYSDGESKYSPLKTISLDQWYELEIYYNTDAMEWEWWLDGSSQDSGSLTGATLDPITFLAGGAVHTGSSATTVYLDRITAATERVRDNTFAVTALKTMAIGPAIETGSGFTIDTVKTFSVGLSNETELAFAITKVKSLSVGLSIETDTAFAIDIAKNMAVGLALETDTAFNVSTAAGIPIGLALETDTASAVISQYTYSTGLSTETDSAFGISVLKQYPVGLTSEADEGFAIDTQKSLAIGLAAESDTAFSGTSLKVLAVGLASETDNSFSVGYSFGAPIGLSGETNSAFSISTIKSTLLGLATETDSAFDIGYLKAGILGLATEADNALNVATGFSIQVAQAIETDTAPIIGYVRGFSAGLALEIDSALSVEAQISTPLGIVWESDNALPISANIEVTVGLAAETDIALALAFDRYVAIGIALETDSALGIYEPTDFMEGTRSWTLPYRSVEWTLPYRSVEWTLPYRSAEWELP